MDIGKVIKEIREARQLTQKTLAERAGMSVFYLSKIENNKREASQQALRVIARELHVPIGLVFALALEPEDVTSTRRKEFVKIRPKIRTAFAKLFELEGVS